MADFAEKPLLTESSPDPSAWQAVVDEYSEIPASRSSLCIDGQTHWSVPRLNMDFANKQVEKLWSEYFFDLHKQKQNRSEQDADLIAREDIHALKLAGVRAFAERRTRLDETDLLFGIEWARASSKSLEYLVAESRATPEDREAFKLLTFITARWQRERVGTSRSDISKHFGGRQGKWHAALERLIKDQLLIVSKGLYFPADIRTSVGLEDDKFM